MENKKRTTGKYICALRTKPIGQTEAKIIELKYQRYKVFVRTWAFNFVGKKYKRYALNS